MTKQILTALLALFFAADAFSQRMVSDTTLTYGKFLSQCASKSKQEVWVVHFWASWNSLSLSTHDGLITARAMFLDKPVRFVGISVDKNKAFWLERLSQYNLAWEQMFLPDQENYDFLRRAFRHNSLPAIFIVNMQGQINRVRDVNELVAGLKELSPYLPNRPYAAEGAIPDARQPQPQPASPGVSPANRADTYTVKPGDTLFGIYKTTGVPVETLRRLNNMRDNNIRAGQVLRLR